MAHPVDAVAVSGITLLTLAGRRFEVVDPRVVRDHVARGRSIRATAIKL